MIFFSRGPFELQSHWGSFEIQKTSHRKICVRTIRYRGATSIVGGYFSPTSLTCLTTGCTIRCAHRIFIVSNSSS